jgi:3-hydroxyacyl-CoA dehydrogenase/enoyl-CoA hydratase/3-hydroxybutyryl-CoA epimerase
MIAENNAFVKLLFTDTARRLIDLFLLRERAGRSATWVAVPDQTPAIRRIAVVGGGIMGAGIAQLAAINGMDVTIKELNCDLAVAGKVRVAQLIDDAVRKGIIDQTQADECLRNVAATSDWKPLENADLAIEAVVEREGVKNEIFAELSQRLAPAAILATNTSSLTVARVTAPVANPRRAAGLHFFNPVHRMQLVEVVRGPETDSRTVAVLVDLVRRLGKTPVVVADGPGFLVNRVLFPYLDEAVRMLAEGFSIETIDRAAVSFGMPMGPLELLDQVGLDIAADVARSLGVYHGDNGPTPIRLSEMVDDGRLGKKSGNGFYAYRDGRRGKATDAATASLRAMDDQHHSRVGPTGVTSIQQRLMYPMINEAARCLEAGVADAPWVIDLAMVLGTGFPPFRGGPLRLVDTWGVGLVVNELEHLQRSEGKRFEPCPMLQEMNHDGRRFYPVAESGKPLPQLASAAGR